MEDLPKHQQTVINFGERIISERNSSKTIAIPKIALMNLADGKFRKLNITFIQQNGEKYLKLTPVFDLKRVI